MLENIVLVFIVLLVERTHVCTFQLQSEAIRLKMQFVLLDYLVHLPRSAKLKGYIYNSMKKMKDQLFFFKKKGNLHYMGK